MTTKKIELEGLEVGCVFSQEIWEEIPRCKGYYEVSNHGRVYSMERTITRYDGRQQTFQGRILKHGKTKTGYHHVTCGKIRQVHRLVAEAFLPNPENKRCVNHKDGNKDNNHVDNLEWATHKENQQHASETGLASGGSMPGSSHPCSKLSEKQVLAIRADTRRRANSQLAREYRVSKVLIGMIKKRKIWNHI